jgi:predicted nucleotidyltransferase
MISINNYLQNLANQLFISYNSTERTKINKSIAAIKYRLNNYFDDKINDIIIFGSYSRGTILPRQFDQNSDIDIMVEFNIDNYETKTPETYRNNLKTFVDCKYPKSISSKDLPSIVLELQNIKFDLVPAIVTKPWFTEKVYIPNSGNNWQETDPIGFNTDLTNANQNFKNIVKPIIRLMKYWNSTNGYPYDSFDLEQIIASMNFAGDNTQTGLLYAIDNLPTNYRSSKLKGKVEVLRNHKDWLVVYLERDDSVKAKERIHKILP